MAVLSVKIGVKGKLLLGDGLSWYLNMYSMSYLAHPISMAAWEFLFAKKEYPGEFKELSYNYLRKMKMGDGDNIHKYCWLNQKYLPLHEKEMACKYPNEEAVRDYIVEYLKLNDMKSPVPRKIEIDVPDDLLSRYERLELIRQIDSITDGEVNEVLADMLPKFRKYLKSVRNFNPYG